MLYCLIYDSEQKLSGLLVEVVLLHEIGRRQGAQAPQGGQGDLDWLGEQGLVLGGHRRHLLESQHLPAQRLLLLLPSLSPGVNILQYFAILPINWNNFASKRGVLR